MNMENEAQKTLTEKVSSPDVDSEFIQKIIQKTSEKKIVWDRTEQGHSGRTVDGNLLMSLQLQQVPIFGRAWRSFVVRRGGEEILKLENSGEGLAFLAGIQETPAHRKVAELLRFLDSARLREVKAAISELDNL